MLLAVPPGSRAQAPAAGQTPPAAPAATIRSLKVIPLAGNQEMNDLQARVMAPLVVQVLDQNDQPVEGAEVVFRFPLDGPGATFADRRTTQTFRTNADGQVAATGWTANGTVGTFQVQVTATRGNEQGFTVVSLTNVTRITEESKRTGKNWWSSHWKRVAIIGGAAVVAVAVVLATHGGSGSNSGGGGTVITGTPGSPTIGGPQ